MARSEHASTSRRVLVAFQEPYQVGDADGCSVASIQPRSLFLELASSSGLKRAETSRAPSQVYASLQLPRSTAKAKAKGRACLVVPVTSGAAVTSEGKLDEQEAATIVLPLSLRDHFDSRLLSDGRELHVDIQPHHPVILSQLILAATSPESYEYAKHSQDQIEAYMDQHLFRQDDSIVISNHPFSIIMMEPVLQGIVMSGQTQIYATLDPSVMHSQVDANETLEEDSDEEIEIDERFLANTVLDRFRSNDDDGDEVSDGESIRGSEAVYEAVPVHDRVLFEGALFASRGRLSLLPRDLDEEDIILLDESGFAALGAFDGDWAIAEVKGQAKARIVRLISATFPSTSSARLKAHLSPLLLQNLHTGDTFDPITPKYHIKLQALRREDREAEVDTSAAPLDCPLPIPFADSLTISRVAGPLSMNRTYQTLFLTALRAHFEGKRRIVREGDIIAVGFDKGKVRWIRNEEGGEGEGSGGPSDDAVDYNLPTSTTTSSITSAVVYFCIANLSPELSEPEAEDMDAKGNGSDDAELREKARVGELGCVVDASLTKMVQTGTTKTRVVDALDWLQVQRDTPALPLQSPLCQEGSKFDKLLSLVNATLLPHAADYGLHLTVLLKGARGSGKKTVVRWVAQHSGVHLIELDCFELLADTDARTEGVLRARFEQAAACGPAILLLQNIDALARKSQALETGQEPMMASVLQDCIAGLRDVSTRSRPAMPISVFGTTSNFDKCPTGVLGCFKHEISLEAPSEAERLAILQLCLQDATLSVDVNLGNLATQTAALVATDLVDLVGRAQMASVERVAALQGVSNADVVAAGMTLTGKDFETALTKARLNYSENIGAPKIPNVTWDDVGGLASVKDDILDTIQLPLEHPELFTDGLKKRSGILLYGPPGTGKTLLAKAVATSCSLNFFSVKGPELLNMYIGESEANVRRVFQRARDAKPCVIFFDELDSIAPKRGNQGDSGGVMDRIVSQLLAELDGMSSSDGGGGEVFVIGATNRPDLLDPALLRPGRFDRMLYLSVSETHADQLNILQALTRKFTLDDDVGNLDIIAEQCPFNLTGADFYALCSDAMLKSMTRKASTIDEKIAQLNSRSQEERAGEKHPYPLTTQYYLDEMAQPEELEIKVSRQDFEAALHELVPSVSMQEMQHYRQVQAKFSSPPAHEEGEAEAKKESTLDPLAEGNGNMSMGQLQELYRRSMALEGGDRGAASEQPMHSSSNNNANGAENGHAAPVEGAGPVQQEHESKKQKSKGKGKGKARAD